MASEAESNEGSNRDSTSGEGEPLRILAAEDNAMNGRVLRAMLRQMGCTMTLASDGEEAVAIAAREDPFDLILMDVQMPVMDGVEATRQIRALGSKGAQPLIVALTAGSMHRDGEACLEAGMNTFVIKPISLARLREVIAEAHLLKASRKTD
jgi:CheY-like chemotaxis protein